MRRAPVLAAVFFAVTALPACREKKAPAPAPSSSGAAGDVVPGFPVPPVLAALDWKPLADQGEIGLPAGCIMKTKGKRAPLPKHRTRFFSPPGSASELILGTDEDGDGLVDRDVVLTAEGNPSRGLPWKRLDAPPLLARTAAGYLSLDVESIGGALERAVVWREPGRLEPLAEGEKLEAVDLACEAGTCAVLLTRAARTAGPGATVFIGDSAAPASSWTRTDVAGEDKGFAPFSIVAVRTKGAVVSLAAGSLLAVWRVDAGKAESLGTITAPYGTYDVALGAEPFAVSPSRSIETPCTVDGFSVRSITASGKTRDVDGQVPPSQVITRRVQGGFMVAWLAPVSCRHDGQSVVRAFLLDESGAPASSTMAVADADGFAVSTEGENADLWLSRRGELVWVRATCHVLPVDDAARGSAPR